MKRGKAAGPDQTTAEMYKLLDFDNVDVLTFLINEMWDQERFPKSLSNAYIASLF